MCVFQVVKVYKAGIQQTLDILFLRSGSDFITSSDCVSRDSADRTLIAWDYQTTAKVSNQIYHVSKRVCVNESMLYSTHLFSIKIILNLNRTITDLISDYWYYHIKPYYQLIVGNMVCGTGIF